MAFNSTISVEPAIPITIIRTLANQDELVQAISEEFGFSREITLDAVNELERLEDAWN
jgi:hypothetical protein